MPTQIEKDVMQILSAIEIQPAQAAEAILSWGNEAVTVVCETALGAYPGLRPKVERMPSRRWDGSIIRRLLKHYCCS